MFSVSRWLAWFALLLLAWSLFFHRLADRDLWNSHEGRAAMDAQSLVQDGRWGLPHLFDGQPELQKPPLYYWLVALVAELRHGSVDAWDVRLPSALAALAGVLLLYELGRRRGRPLAGFLAAVVLATSMHYTWIARVGRIDIPLTLTTTVAILALQSPSPWWRPLLAYLSIAGGILLKGPIGAVLPAVVLAFQQIVEGGFSWRGWLAWARRLRAGWGIPLVLVLALPWFWWANRETHGDLFRVFFWHHNIERGLGGSEALKAHPWWFYGPQLLYDFLPWSPVLLLAAVATVKKVSAPYFASERGALATGRRPVANAPGSDGARLPRLGAVWLLGVMVVLSCSRFKRADYLLPAYPGAALFVGCALERWLYAAARPRRLAVGLATVVLVYAAGWWYHVSYTLPREEPTRDYRPFAEVVRQAAPAPRTVLFFRTESHALAFHVGRPLRVFVEWQELNRLAGDPEPSYVVMPPESAAEWPRYLTAGRLEEVARTDQAMPPHEKPLVLLRTRPARP